MGTAEAHESDADNDENENENEEIETRTCSEILEDSILELIVIGSNNGMSSDEVDAVLFKIVNDRAADVRKCFRLRSFDDDSTHADR